MRKVFKLRSAGQAGKTIPGGAGPLKSRRKQDSQTPKQWIEHALARLAARWRILGEILIKITIIRSRSYPLLVIFSH